MSDITQQLNILMADTKRIANQSVLPPMIVGASYTLFIIFLVEALF